MSLLPIPLHTLCAAEWHVIVLQNQPALPSTIKLK